MKARTREGSSRPCGYIRLTGRERPFDESNWWHWGRLHHVAEGPRIYVNCKTRRARPFFLHDCPNYDGSVLALFPRLPGMDLALAADMLNDRVDWAELGFICDGRFLLTQRTLQNCLLPPVFEKFQQMAQAQTRRRATA